MKRQLLLGIACLGSAVMLAQADEPHIFDTFNCLQLSGNGEWMLGRSNTWYYEETDTYSTETSVCNVLTGEIFGLDDLFTLNPFSRPISSKGIAILSTYDEATDWMEVPYLIVPGQQPQILDRLYKEGPYAGKECYACAITDNASHFLAYYEEYPKQYPFVCPINDDLTIGDPEFLPLPQEDIFGNTPFCVALTCISDDANTVAGVVSSIIPGTGTIDYPIVYTRSEDGEWSFSFPLESLYENIDPENVYDFYPNQIGLSPDGTKMVCTREIFDKLNNFPSYQVWLINLAEGTFSPIESSNKDIVATRVLDDGTITGTFFATIRVSYVLTPGASDFVDFVTFAKENNEAYGEWMEENLNVLVRDVDENGQVVEIMMPNTGQVFVADDLSVFGSGFQTSQYDEYYNLKLWSYIFTDFEVSGVGTPGADASYSHTSGDAIYTIDGRRVGRATTPGLYIINGKKVLVRSANK